MSKVSDTASTAFPPDYEEVLKDEKQRVQFRAACKAGNTPKASRGSRTTGPTATPTLGEDEAESSLSDGKDMLSSFLICKISYWLSFILFLHFQFVFF